MRRSRHSFAEEVGVDLDPHSVVDGWYNGGAAGEDIVEAARVQQQQEEARQAAADLETDKLVPVTGVAPAAHVISLSEPSAAHGISRAQLVAKLEHLTGSSSGIAGWVWLCGCVAVWLCGCVPADVVMSGLGVCSGERIRPAIQRRLDAYIQLEERRDRLRQIMAYDDSL